MNTALRLFAFAIVLTGGFAAVVSPNTTIASANQGPSMTTQGPIGVCPPVYDICRAHATGIDLQLLHF